jgi:hypothetical protein
LPFVALAGLQITETGKSSMTRMPH